MLGASCTPLWRLYARTGRARAVVDVVLGQAEIEAVDDSSAEGDAAAVPPPAPESAAAADT